MWVTILRTIRKPVEDVLRLRVVRCQADTLDEGLEWHEIESIKVPVYSVARTLVDLFRQRNKIGIDIAIEAPREVARSPVLALGTQYAGRQVPDDAIDEILLGEPALKKSEGYVESMRLRLLNLSRERGRL